MNVLHDTIGKRILTMRIRLKIDWKALTQLPGSKDLSSKKILILDSALRIISEKGLHQLSIAELSRESGISKPLILYHYPTLDSIIEELFFFSGKMARYFIEKNLNREASFETKVMQMIKSLFEWTLYNREVSEFFILMFHSGTKNPQMQKILKEILQTAHDLWERIFLESMRYKSLEELRIHINGLQSMITGSLIIMIATNRAQEANDLLTEIRLNAESLLGVELPVIEIN